MSEVNPVGTPDISVIKDQIQEILDAWLLAHPTVNSWWSKVRVGWIEVVSFLIKAADYLLLVLDKINMAGADKKATLILALNQIWDFIIPKLLPIWLKPFESRIKNFVFSVVIIWAIDFAIKKYREAKWSDSNELSFANFK